MSILNLTNDGLPNVLVVLYTVIARARNPIERDALLERIAPSAYSEGAKMARQTLNRWTELGLFSDDGNGVYLTTPLSELPRDEPGWIAATRRAARAVAFDEANNAEFWAAEGARAADLTRSLAWLLIQNVYTFSFQDREIEALEDGQVEDASKRLMQNNTRRNGLQLWAHFLGFVRQPSGGDIDPTVAVRDVLADTFGTESSMPADSFVVALGERLPVLDRGQWRGEVVRALRPDKIPPLGPLQISSALSRALLCLRFRGDLQFEQRSDTGSGIVLSGSAGPRYDYTFQSVSLSRKEGKR